MQYSFEYPSFLLLLPLALCFIWCKKGTQTYALPRLDWIPKKEHRINLNTLLKILIYLLTLLALASPFLYESITPSQKHGRDIVLALDCSGSMRESDFSKKEPKKTKFELLQTLSLDFIDRRPSDNFGIVIFGTFAFSASPITYDHESLKTLLSMQEVEIAGKNTAIGDAIAQSLKTLSFSHAKEKIIILITDGINNAGKISIKDALSLAKKANVRIYTIGLGKKEHYDTFILDTIAQQTNAKAFHAITYHDLEEIYHDIDRLEVSNITSQQYLNKNPLFIWLLLPALILLFLLIAREEKQL